MSSFTPNTIDVKEKLKLEKALKENLERERELRLQEEINKTEIERNRKQAAKKLKTCGIIDAYDFFLDKLCKHGLPKKEDVFDFAALCILKYERLRKAEKMKQVQEKINKHLHRYDIEELLPPKVEEPTPVPVKGKRAKSSTKVIPESPKGKGKGNFLDKGKMTDKENTKGKGKKGIPDSPPKSPKNAKGKKVATPAPPQPPSPKKGGKGK